MIVVSMHMALERFRIVGCSILPKMFVRKEYYLKIVGGQGEILEVGQVEKKASTLPIIHACIHRHSPEGGNLRAASGHIHVGGGEWVPLVRSLNGIPASQTDRGSYSRGVSKEK